MTQTAPWLSTRRLAVVLLALFLAVPMAAQPELVQALSSAQGVAWGGKAVATVDPGLAATAVGGEVAVILTAAPGQVDAVAEAVRTTGGAVRAELPIIDGVSARIPLSAVDALARSGLVLAITADRSIGFETVEYSADTTASTFAKVSGATAAWTTGRTGRGVGVAVIDTGISSMNDFSGRLVHGPDLSGEGSTVDTYGHGTVMAGIIGGSGADSATQNGGAYTGVAPGATLVGVKAAGRNGAADITTMLQAMHWVSAYKDQFNIRVLNISWGFPSTQSTSVDPVNYAVQRLWQQGIVVVVAAGNAGPNASTLTKPADDPMAITVGAFNDNKNLVSTDDDIPSWSSRGPSVDGLVKPDVVASGRTLIATRSFGSAVEVENPKALVSPSYIRGSGTSEAAAVVSGLSALLLEARPGLTPDQVKHLFRVTADPLAGMAQGNTQGRGRVRLDRALTADASTAPVQSPSSTGLGSVEASRGGLHVQTDCGENGTIDVIQGEIDTKCIAWDGNAWTGNAWTGNAWTGNAWTGNAWTGNAWTGNAWTNATWTGNAWTGGQWTGNAWTGNAWTGNAWTGNAWTGNAWTGSTWTGNAWTGNAWTGNAWTGSAYEEDLLGDIFTSAFFGLQPRPGLRIAGEVFTPLQSACALHVATSGSCL